MKGEKSVKKLLILCGLVFVFTFIFTLLYKISGIKLISNKPLVLILVNTINTISLYINSFKLIFKFNVNIY